MEGADLPLVVEDAMVAFPLLGLAQRPDIYSRSDHYDRRLLLDAGSIRSGISVGRQVSRGGGAK